MINFQDALVDPTKFFKSPQEVALSTDLTRDQKIAILNQWGSYIREIEVASDEGMIQKKELKGEAKKNDLQAVTLALESLNAHINVEHTPPTKQGG